MSRLSLVLLAALLAMSMNLSAEEDTEAQKLEKLKQVAELKKKIFRWELATLRDVKFMERNLKNLKTQRVKIQKEVEELEFLLKNNSDQPPE